MEDEVEGMAPEGDGGQLVTGVMLVTGDESSRE